MSQSKPITVSDAFKVPDLETRHDRFCSHCCCVLLNFALEKHYGMKCPRCNAEVEFLDKSDGLYNRCVRCQGMIRCTWKFCQLCSRENVNFDPKKVDRLKQQTRAQVREEVKVEFKAEAEIKDLERSLLQDVDCEDKETQTDWEDIAAN